MSLNSRTKGQSLKLGTDREATNASATPAEGSPFASLAQDGTQLDQERIERAKKLLDQDGYPSEAILKSIAHHLAKNWASPQEPASPRLRRS